MAAFGGDAMEKRERESSPSSRSSSGCQSGWTLYLDHSNNNGVRYVPAYGDQRWMLLQQADDAGDRDDDEEEEDSMASDASSGPRPRPRQEDDDERDFGLRRHDELFFVDQCSYSTSSGAIGSGFFGSCTRSRSSSPQGGGVARTTAGVVFRGEATPTRQYRRKVIVIDDELDDTASSSAVFSRPMAMMHAR